MLQTDPLLIPSDNIQTHDYQTLITLFNNCFFASYETLLVKGGDEPVYLPKGDGRLCHEIHFAHGFFSSALHEVAHWLLAGEHRRTLEDFGYWYEPDGRTPEQQGWFEQVEARPQALEWVLSQAAAFRFRVSADNLSGALMDTSGFKLAILAEAQRFVEQGLPSRAERFRLALAGHYGTELALTRYRFALQDLD